MARVLLDHYAQRHTGGSDIQLLLALAGQWDANPRAVSNGSCHQGFGSDAPALVRPFGTVEPHELLFGLKLHRAGVAGTQAECLGDT